MGYVPPEPAEKVALFQAIGKFVWTYSSIEAYLTSILVSLHGGSRGAHALVYGMGMSVKMRKLRVAVIAEASKQHEFYKFIILFEKVTIFRDKLLH